MSAGTVASTSTTAPKVSGCSNATVRARPHSTAWAGSHRSPALTGWALRVNTISRGGSVGRGHRRHQPPGGVEQPVAGRGVGPGRGRGGGVEHPGGAGDHRRQLRGVGVGGDDRRSWSPPSPLELGRQRGIADDQPATRRRSRGRWRAALPARPIREPSHRGITASAGVEPRPPPRRIGRMLNQCRVWLPWRGGQLGCGSGGCGVWGGLAARGVEAGVELTVSSPSRPRVPMQRCGPVSPTVSVIDWASIGCGLISTKVACSVGGRADRPAAAAPAGAGWPPSSRRRAALWRSGRHGGEERDRRGCRGCKSASAARSSGRIGSISAVCDATSMLTRRANTLWRSARRSVPPRRVGGAGDHRLARRGVHRRG